MVMGEGRASWRAFEKFKQQKGIVVNNINLWGELPKPFFMVLQELGLEMLLLSSGDHMILFITPTYHRTQ